MDDDLRWGLIYAHNRANANTGELAVLQRHAHHEVAHADDPAVLRGQEGRRQGRVANPAAGELEVRREEPDVDVRLDRGLLGQDEPPDPLPVLRLREREVDHVVQPAQERLVDVVAEVRGEDDGARVALHLLEEVRDLDVRVAVVRVAHL